MHPILNCRVQILLELTMLSALMMVIGGCGSINTTPDDLVPQSIATTMNGQKWEGSVNVQASVPKATGRSSYVPMSISQYVDGNKLKVALEKSITQKGVFSQVEQGNADYVLDVWVDSVHTRLEVVGEGFIFDMTSIWRLTRAKDGKVLVCEFVKGHGGARGVGSGAYPPSISAATRDMVQKGLTVLSDQPGSHLAALSKAGLRASMGPAVPEGLVKFAENVKLNWSQLRTGLSVDEVDKLLGFRAAILEQYISEHTQQYTTGLYYLAFIDGKLSLWQLQQH
jgi:hypothetical protein